MWGGKDILGYRQPKENNLGILLVSNTFLLYGQLIFFARNTFILAHCVHWALQCPTFNVFSTPLEKHGASLQCPTFNAFSTPLEKHGASLCDEDMEVHHLLFAPFFCRSSFLIFMDASWTIMMLEYLATLQIPSF